MELVAKAETAEKEKEAQMRRAAETSRVYQERVNKLLDYEMTGRSTRNDDRLFEDALKIYDTAIAEFPKDGDVARNMPKVMSSIYHGRAECLRMARKDYDGSIENALEAIALDKKNGNAYFELANSYAGKGEFDLADSNFQRAYELGVIDSLFTRGRLWFLVANQSDRLGHRTDALNQARRAVAIFDECLVNSRVVAADRASAEQYIKELRQKYSID